MRATLWALAAVAATGSVLLLAACGSGGPPPGSAEALYLDLGCAKCHGREMQGLRSGPPLTGLDDRWDEDGLVAFLQDPQGFIASHPRLAYRFEQYAIAMHAYGTTPEEDLRKLSGLIIGEQSPAAEKENP